MFTMSILGSAAQLEKSMIGLRTREALATKKENGQILGRRLGSKNKSKKLDGKETIIKGYLDKKLNKSAIAKLLGVSRDVLYDKLADMREQGLYRDWETLSVS